MENFTEPVRGANYLRFNACEGKFGPFRTLFGPLDTPVSLPLGHPPAPPVSPRTDGNLLVRGLVVSLRGVLPPCRPAAAPRPHMVAPIRWGSILLVMSLLLPYGASKCVSVDRQKSSAWQDFDKRAHATVTRFSLSFKYSRWKPFMQITVRWPEPVGISYLRPLPAVAV